jgi:hypothetical protein
VAKDLRNRSLETLFNLLQNILVGLCADEGDGDTLGTKTTGTTDTMEVGVSVKWEIVVNGQIDTLDINTTTEDIGGNADALVKFLEFLISLDTVCLLVYS